MRITAVGSAFPPNYYSQEELLTELRRVWADKLFNLDRLEQLHHNVLVGGRHLALPIEEYEQLNSFGEANDAWIRVGEEVGAAAIEHALEIAGLGVEDVDALFLVSVTGIATPSLDARLINRLRLPPTIRRTPIFGLGCVAGAAGIARAADYVKAYPDKAAVLLSVELCSLTLQREDFSIANLISSGLFGDGAAAVVITGAEHPRTTSGGPEIVATRSVFYPDTEQVMGWSISERGFQIVLSAEVPDMVWRLRHNVDEFLAEHGLQRSDIGTWVSHPGGPKVLEAMQEALGIDRESLDITWRSLKQVGNLSSTSVLLVLAETMDTPRLESGSLGLLLAMGPGFCSELVLLRW